MQPHRWQRSWRLANAEPKRAFSLLDWRTFSSALPAGHPFVNISGGQYWTSTTVVEQTPTPCPNHACEAFVVSFFSWGIFSDAKIGDNHVIPVRGGS